jgi:hypothetical protein
MSDYQSLSGYGKWYDTPICNRPQCPICSRYRHGNQKTIHHLDHFGLVCNECWKNSANRGWYVEQILTLKPELTEVIDNLDIDFFDKILTSTKFPYVVGQHTHLDEYFLELGFLPLEEQTN